jgi:D-sedoheptulose 7-phosphate isomerase
VFAASFLQKVTATLMQLDADSIEATARALAGVRARGGRLFILGVGGSAGHASHATNDFRKCCGVEAYCPTDNVSELTAHINDEGWEGVFAAWLATSRLGQDDGILVFSVGGGSLDPPVSANLVHALEYATQRGATITAIVGRDGDFSATVANACVIVPTVDETLVTPIVEGLAAVIWHLLVSHPVLAHKPGRWEGISAGRCTPPA